MKADLIVTRLSSLLRTDLSFFLLEGPQEEEERVDKEKESAFIAWRFDDLFFSKYNSLSWTHGLDKESLS